MFQFCFNDSISKDGTNDGLVTYLSSSLEHFEAIKKQFPTNVDGIITDRCPSNLILNNRKFTLANCIQYLQRDLKTIALSNFSRYPIDNFYNQIDDGRLLDMKYTIVVNDISIEAINAKIVEENGGILFTLQVHDDLKKDKLIIIDKEQQTCEVMNQYGNDNNTNFISEFINADVLKSLKGFNKLLALVGDCFYNNRFKKDFENLTSSTQNFLLKEVEHAIKRKAKTRFYPDDKLIKDVTPGREKEVSVFELRIYSPVAIRLYFYETPEKLFFGSIEGKPKPKIQDNDILNAASIIKELMILNS